MAEVKHNPERKHTVHRALHLLLHHAAISQPEIKTEAAELQAALDEQFLKEPAPDYPQGAPTRGSKRPQPAAGGEEQ